MGTHNDGRPAFPIPLNPGQSYGGHSPCDGMTLRQYAAIHLRVPDSGDDWLDDMIREARWNDIAAKAIPLVASRAELEHTGPEEWVEACFEIADAMLAARGAA